MTESIFFTETVTPSPSLTPVACSGCAKHPRVAPDHLDTKRRGQHRVPRATAASLSLAKRALARDTRVAEESEGLTFQPHGIYHDQHPAGHPCTEVCADLLIAMLGPEWLFGPLYINLSAAQTYSAALRARNRPSTTEEAIQ